MRLELRTFASVLAIVSGACTGAIGDPRGAPEETVRTEPRPGGVRIWRLDRTEYAHTLRDLLGAAPEALGSLPPDVGGDGLASDAARNRVAVPEAIAYRRIAESVAANVAGDDERLAAIWPCTLDALDDAACGRAFVVAFGARAFRRPLAAEEAARWVALHEEARTRAGGRVAVQLVVESMLQSPSFLFRTELGAPGREGVVLLTPHELASALAYFLWDTMPDAELVAAASAGPLVRADELERQARRLVADERAREAAIAFVLVLLEDAEGDGATRPPESVADWPALRAEMRASLREQIALALDADARLETLLAPEDGSGVLLHPAVLAFHASSTGTSPPRRGRFVAERLLCRAIAAPPPGLTVPARAPTGAETTRAYFERITSREPCRGCHATLNPLGFAFERFDELGRMRESEHGLPIDEAVDLSPFPELGLGRAETAGELARALARSAAVRECVARHAFRHALGRRETSGDRAALGAIVARFEETGGDLRELFVAIALSPSLRTRVREEETP